MMLYRIIRQRFFVYLLCKTIIICNPTFTSSFVLLERHKIWKQHDPSIISLSTREKFEVLSFKRKNMGCRQKRFDRFSGTKVFGLAEWRKEVQTGTSNEHNKDGQAINTIRNKNSVLLLPFSSMDILIPNVGESRNLVLKEGRFLDLFQDCLDDYHSIVGMAIMGEDGLYSHCVLCEIADFDILSGYRGKVTVQVTLLAVGRAKIQNWMQMRPVLQATCTELFDHHPNKHASYTNSQDSDNEANSLLSQIEKIIPDKKQQKYKRCLEAAIQNSSFIYQENDDSSAMVKDDDKDESNVTKKNEILDGLNESRSGEELFAASWAILSMLSDRSSPLLHEAILATDVKTRLELAQRALLNENLIKNDYIDADISVGPIDDEYLGKNMNIFQ